jgi:dipeptidase E
MERQIIAAGGGGFSAEPDNLHLENYILRQSRASVPKVCFVPSASGDPDGYTERFYSAFNQLNCQPRHLSLFKLPTADLASFLLEQDVIYVGGGNTRSLLGLWKEWELDIHMRKAWEHGVLLSGTSAGAMVWFEEALTDSLPGDLARIPCLGFLSGSYCPHFNSEKRRKPKFHGLVASGSMKNGVGVDDGVALHFVDNELKKAVGARTDVGARYVKKSGDACVEVEIEIDRLV